MIPSPHLILEPFTFSVFCMTVTMFRHNSLNELISCINYCSFQVAMGVPLHRIKDVRVLFDEDPWGNNMFDFEK